MLSREASIDIDKLSNVIVMYTSLTIIYPVIVQCETLVVKCVCTAIISLGGLCVPYNAGQL